MSTYDDGEGPIPGDPNLGDLDPKKLKKLQKLIDFIQNIKNPIEKSKAVKAFVKDLNSG